MNIPVRTCRERLIREYPRRANRTRGATGSGERCERTFSRGAIPFEIALVRLVEAACKVENEGEDFRDEESATDATNADAGTCDTVLLTIGHPQVKSEVRRCEDLTIDRLRSQQPSATKYTQTGLMYDRSRGSRRLS